MIRNYSHPVLRDREAINVWWESTWGLNVLTEVWLERVFGEWQPHKEYEIDDLAVTGRELYRCEVAHAGETFDVLYWEAIDTTYQPGTDYQRDDIVRCDGTLYICIEAHTAGSFDGSYWEDEVSIWPVREGDEILTSYFEDIRKRIWLIECHGWTDLDLVKYFGTGDDEGNYIPWDSSNWSGKWGGYEEDPMNPGYLALYKDDTGVTDLYVSFVAMFTSQLEAHPPVHSSGQLDYFWRLAPHPNRYHHYDHNAGKPTIGANGRLIVSHISITAPECDLHPYNHQVEAHNHYPRQVVPRKQQFPAKVGGEIVDRIEGFRCEIKKEFITQDIGTSWNRTYAGDTYPNSCIYPQRLTEYILEGPESEGSDMSWQYRYDQKMCEAYQDRVIVTAELATTYLGAVDQDFIDFFIERKELDAEAWIVDYGYYTARKVVSNGGIYYVCYNSHSSSADKEPGTSGGASYWKTPPYQPEYLRLDPVYESLFDELWQCNSSTYEYLLKHIPDSEDIPHYDWWWDSSHPAVSAWLWTYRDGLAEELKDINMPLPCGCWRRTWKHSMQRFSVMWPGESEPPEYYPTKYCVTQAVYDAIPEATQKYYVAVNNPPIFELTEEQEDLLTERHDPKQLIKDYEYDTLASIYKWYTYLEYEIHHDLVNDMREALKLLYLVDNAGVFMKYFSRTKLEAGPLCATAIDAYNTGKNAIENEEVTPPRIWENGTSVPAGSPFWILCGWPDGFGVSDYGSPPEARYQASDCNIAEPSQVWFSFWITKKLDIERPMSISHVLTRVAYKGLDADDFSTCGCPNPEPPDPPTCFTIYEPCVVGFGDMVIAPPLLATEKIKYMRLQFEGATEWFWDGTDWWLDCHYEATIQSSFPGFRGADMFWAKGSYIDASGYDMHKFCVFEIDWNAIPASIFEEVEDNYCLEV